MPSNKWLKKQTSQEDYDYMIMQMEN